MARSLGAFGEAWAVGYLTHQGYSIVDRNVRYRAGEIDIVASDGDELVFVEVKCRRNRSYGAPQESVSAARFARLARAVEEYLERNDIRPASYRVDVLALLVDGSGRVTTCDHIKAVESPER